VRAPVVATGIYPGLAGRWAAFNSAGSLFEVSWLVLGKTTVEEVAKSFCIRRFRINNACIGKIWSAAVYPDPVGALLPLFFLGFRLNSLKLPVSNGSDKPNLYAIQVI
jgi:hypothetical protein